MAGLIAVAGMLASAPVGLAQASDAPGSGTESGGSAGTPGLGDLLKMMDRLLGERFGGSGAALPDAEADAGPDAEGGLSVAAATATTPRLRLSDDPDPEHVARSETGLLDVHVRDVEIVTLLEMLSYESQANIVASKSVSGQVSANLYAVTLEQALDAILTPNQFLYRPIDGTIFVGNADEIAKLRPPPQTRVFRLKYIRADEAAKAIKAVVSAGAVVVEGGKDDENQRGGRSGEDEMKGAGADYLIVTDQPDRLDAAAAILAEIDERPQQVLIEATVLRATLNESNQLGVDFSMLGGVDFQNVNSTSNAAQDLQTGQLPSGRFQDTSFNINTEFAGNVADGGFTFGIIANSIATFIRALEEITDVVVVANPKIATLNKQEAQVIVGRRDGYLTTTVTETAAIQTVEFLETGTQIKFRPMINRNGAVRLLVHPKDSNGGLTAANLPFEETTEAHADILVQDGHTVLIGGLFRERTVNTESQIPVLGNIPAAGLLFGFRNDQTVREEVIILLTVHIMKETEAEQEFYLGLAEDVERIRVGMRRGLMGTGRSVLGHAFYREALEKLEAGDEPRALLNVRMALACQPKQLQALKLHERLLNERLWSEEGTRMRTMIWELVDLEPDGTRSTRQIFGRPRVDASGFLLPEDDKGSNP
jgi:type IV pilus assembly protein PilQ